MIGLVACILSLYMVSSITIQSVEQHRLENSLMANMSNEMDHLEFCYFTMVRMMQQMGEDGSIGSMLEDYLYSENNFEKYQRRRELENEMVSIGFIKPDPGPGPGRTGRCWKRAPFRFHPTAWKDRKRPPLGNSDLFARDQVLDLALDEDGSFSGGFGDYYLVAKRSDMGFIYVNGVARFT